MDGRDNEGSTDSAAVAAPELSIVVPLFNEAAGLEAFFARLDAVLDRGEAALGITTDRIHALRQCVSNCRCGGTVSLSGVYGGFPNHVNLGAAFQKGVTIRMGQCNVMNYMDKLMRDRGGQDRPFLRHHPQGRAR